MKRAPDGNQRTGDYAPIRAGNEKPATPGEEIADQVGAQRTHDQPAKDIGGIVHAYRHPRQADQQSNGEE